MAISTYSELQTAVANWMARSDLTARIPEFIALAEAKFNRDLMVRQMEQRSTATVDLTSDEPQFITLPTDFQTMRSIYLPGVVGKPALQYLSSAQFNDLRFSIIGDTADQPRYFTVLNDELELLATPDQAYVLEMVFRKNVPALSDSNTTNWLLTYAPDAYLYGALREAGIFMQEDERIPVWTAGYKNAVDALNQQSMSASFNAGPATMRISGATP